MKIVQRFMMKSIVWRRIAILRSAWLVKFCLLCIERHPQIRLISARLATARERKVYYGNYVSAATIEKVKSLGEDYIAILSKLLDKTVDEYHAVP